MAQGARGDRGAKEGGAGSGSGSLAVERVVQLLETLAGAARPMTIAELSQELGLHRSIVYRYLRTLDRRRLVRSTPDGKYEPDVGLIPLANSVSADLRTIAFGHLTELANEVGATAFLTQMDTDRTICLSAVEPQLSVAHVVYRPGSYGPPDQGAPAVAILSGNDEQPDEPERVIIAREAGYAHSAGALVAGVESIACPLRPTKAPATISVAVLFPVNSQDLDVVVRAVRRTADSITELIKANDRL
ncbi:IclR family transcriptional regulator [Streptomyces sp. NPDC096354]|uniref:IclR family transcriptional regulator n=1 Tax=Streptomyces sp. NPDC096354 TaxID=3366088 RepID=UPI0037FBA1CC